MNKYDGHEVKDWKPLVGHRCLVVEDRPGADVFEVAIVEVSPGGRPKFRFLSGVESWKSKDEYLLVEDLGETDVLFQKNV